ncbi:MAG: 3-oxoacyl-[acyl-carrier-protein] synthase 3 [Candidatus Hydrogenedentota bacterium]
MAAVRPRIISTGQCLPDKVLTNIDLEDMMDTTDEWIRQRTGIAQRHMVDNGQTLSDLAAGAAKQAMDRAGITSSDIDFVLCSTMTADYLFPSAACLVQDRLGAKRAGAADLNAACSGFVYGLQMADGLIRSGIHKTILVIGAEVMSCRLDWGKRNTAVLFGDGAGAVVVRADTSDRGILSTYTRSDGGDYELIYVPAGGSKTTLTPDNINHVERSIVMDGRGLYKRAVHAFGEAVEEALKAAEVAADDLTLFIPHQANKRIIDAAAERIGLPSEKIYMNLDRVANTSAASIPIALDDAVCEGRLKENDLLLLAAFGAGLTWAGSVLRW